MLINKHNRFFLIPILFSLLLLTSCSHKEEKQPKKLHANYEVTNNIIFDISGNSFCFFLEQNSLFTAICSQNELTVMENSMDGKQQNKFSLEIEDNYEIESFCHSKEDGFYFLIKKTTIQKESTDYEIKTDHRIMATDENGMEKSNFQVKKNGKTPDHEIATSEGVFFSYGKELYRYDINGTETYICTLDGKIDSIALWKNNELYALVQNGPKEILYSGTIKFAKLHATNVLP